VEKVGDLANNSGKTLQTSLGNLRKYVIISARVLATYLGNG
jgi:hypothetical protein